MASENPTRESAKERSLRVPLSHHQKSTPLARGKGWLSLVAGVIAVVYVGWLLVDSRAGGKHISPGPVAAAHTRWDHDCATCHRDFQPLGADSVSLVGARDRATANQKCAACHPRAMHHANMLPRAEDCAACHDEHRGLTADIARPADELCTSCHGNLAAHHASDSKSSFPDVTAFQIAAGDKSNHPDFSWLRGDSATDRDPGNIKFNHWLHLQAGVAPVDAKRKWKHADIDESLRANYAANRDGHVQLHCSSCHQPDANGSSMQPIAFEKHCQACHRLDVPLAGANGPAPQVPHGLRAGDLARALDGLLWQAQREQLAAPMPTADESGALPLIPGKTLGRNLAQKLGDDLLLQRSKHAALLAAKCGQCHEAQVSEGLPDVADAKLPTRWLSHARFSHAAHRSEQCSRCHAEAAGNQPKLLPRPGMKLPGGYEFAEDDRRVMIAGMDTCAQCHSPARGDSGGARFDCAECHTYHPAHQSPSAAAGPGSIAPVSYLGPPIQNASLAAPTPEWIGMQSCAATGCHGDARPESPAWRSAAATWLARDPHAQAQQALLTARAREMTRAIDRDAEHSRVVEERCIGCHATPSGPSLLGVQCESCHGPAGDWALQHHRAGFQRTTPGFVDTKDLSARAATCLPCHIGPHGQAGNAQVVDHDLIAAGHPRLNFEFHAYLENLPAHWDANRDQGRYAGDYHYQAWMAGQRQQAEQLEELAKHFGAKSPGNLNEFALFDCFACHQQLAPQSNSTRPPGFGLPQPVDWPPGDFRELDDQGFTAHLRLHLAKTLLGEAAKPELASHDKSVQAYLAARAIAADFRPTATENVAAEVQKLNSALYDLGRFLGQDCFFAADGRQGEVTQYSSPVSFDRDALAPRIQAAQDAISILQLRLAEQRSP